MPEIKHPIHKREYSELARCIAFHELNEVVLGDIPTYTPLSEIRRKSARIYAENKLRIIPPDERHRIANDFIWLFLEERNKASLRHVQKLVSDENPISNMFTMFDKLDPIIAIWRYLHHFRSSRSFDVDNFLRRVKDFFENPDVKNFARAKDIDVAVHSLILDLQDRNKAKEYYLDPDFFKKNKDLLSIDHKVLECLIEGKEIIFSQPG